MEISSNGQSEYSISDEDVFNIAVSSDNHCGYKEIDPVHGYESFKAFEEVLQKALENNSDFMILGGDLYHEKKPSRKSIFEVCTALNNAVYGEQHVKFETFEYPDANYLKDWLKVQLPIFMIHGNHDDPIGLENLSNIDFLHSSNFINYFGKVTNVDNIEVKPILFHKGKTKIALYGIGNMKEERLNFAEEQNNLTFMRPLKEDGEADESYFNILVVHQNRFKGRFLGVPAAQAIKEEFFPTFINLVIWGHEHECIPEPKEVISTGYHIFQPGSTVATSLIEAESKQKHTFQLQIYKKAFKIESTPLKNARPILFKQVSLSDCRHAIRSEQDVEDYVLDEIHCLLKDYRKSPSYRRFKLPFLRLKVEHTGQPIVDNKRLRRLLKDKIANSEQVCLWWKSKAKVRDRQDDGIDEAILKADKKVLEAYNLNISQEQEMEMYILKAMKKNPSHLNIIDPEPFFDALNNNGKDGGLEAFMSKVHDKILAGLEEEVKEKMSREGYDENKLLEELQELNLGEFDKGSHEVVLAKAVLARDNLGGTFVPDPDAKSDVHMHNDKESDSDSDFGGIEQELNNKKKKRKRGSKQQKQKDEEEEKVGASKKPSKFKTLREKKSKVKKDTSGLDSSMNEDLYSPRKQGKAKFKNGKIILVNKNKKFK